MDNPDLEQGVVSREDTSTSPYTAASSDAPEEPDFADALFRQRRKHGKFREIEVAPGAGPLFDTHCHPQLTPYPASGFARAAVWGVEHLACVIDLSDEGPRTIAKYDEWLHEALLLIPSFAQSIGRDPSDVSLPEIRFILGCHPHNASRFDKQLEETIRACLKDPRACAIGESGLDFYYNVSPQDAQISMFKRQIEMSHELDLPLCLHVRDAHELAFEILEKEGWPKAGCVLHCYNLDPDTLKPWIERDCYVGFDGPLTFKNNECVVQSAAIVPEDRLLVETDAPFMAPEPTRGMACYPHHVLHIANRLAEVRDKYTVEAKRTFFEKLVENGLRLYKRDPKPWQEGSEI
ncbi:MAG: TatD family hydrolase [Eggerthellaceae bacterium]|nr:TatD family hydrolase [Eggerthellaceae bacterium]